MKNIHVLPTHKPSRLYLISKTLTLSILSTKHENNIGRHIYITSDETTKCEICWHYNRIFNTISKEESAGYKKIILTTDQDLIKDGVQAIDNEFLEWFVKNPSCEEVDVEIESKFDRVDGHYHDVWEIIIPKEEPKFEESINNLFNLMSSANSMFSKKEETEPHSFCETPKEKCTMNYCDENGCQNRKRELEEPEQETLEEVRVVKRTELYNSILSIVKQIPRKEVEGDAMDAPSCAYELQQLFLKWQQERSYSDEDLREAFGQGQDNMDYSERYGWNSKLTEQEWFEQFKKK